MRETSLRMPGGSIQVLLMPLARRWFLHLATGFWLAFTSLTATAQGFPIRQITLVVPFAAGGPNDTIARIIAEPMRATRGQPVVIENVPGANGVIGISRVARAPADGYTLIIGSFNSHVANGAMYAALPYDVLTDFEPVTLVSNAGGSVIVARRTLPADDLRGFVAWLKANPDKALAGTPGVGSSTQIYGAMFQNLTGTRFRHVPYRGGGPAMQDLVAGHIDFMLDTPVTALPQLLAHTIKAFAVAAPSRLPAAPDIPTVDEAGLPGFYTSAWYALWVPKGTPQDVIGRINVSVVEALSHPDVGRRFADLGQTIPPTEQLTPAALAKLHRAEIEKWWPIIKAANIHAE
jgi:tripartite-type tricarboxylate transporter receptor subunit TctC